METEATSAQEEVLEVLSDEARRSISSSQDLDDANSSGQPF
jgi:hypothetical protein